MEDREMWEALVWLCLGGVKDDREGKKRIS